MEIRKVQLTGGSSYVLTLPKEWIKALNVKKNDPLGLITQPDGTLLVTTRTTEVRPQRNKDIKVEELRDQTHLFRVLIAAYIMGYTTITLRSSGRMPAQVRETVMKFSQMTIGPEVMEESPSSITIKDLLNPAEMPFDKTIRRMYILVRTMHEDAFTALEKRERALAEDVQRRDMEINRLNWLAARQHSIMLSDVTLARRMGITLEDASHYFLIARILERIGDHGVRISRAVTQLLDKKLEKELYGSLKQASKDSLELLNSSLESWFAQDIRRANESLDLLPVLISKVEQLNQAAQHVKSATSIPVTDIGESVRRTGEYAADIAELVINNLVLKEK
ncbi:MAG: phosphate uptake regulator PhoU [Thermoplasmata archaeon]